MIDFWCDIDWLPFIMAVGLWGERDMVCKCMSVHAPCARIDWNAKSGQKMVERRPCFFSLTIGSWCEFAWNLFCESWFCEMINSIRETMLCDAKSLRKTNRKQIKVNFTVRNKQQFLNSNICARVDAFFLPLTNFSSGRPQCGNSVMHTLFSCWWWRPFLWQLKNTDNAHSYIYEVTTDFILASSKAVASSYRDDRRYISDSNGKMWFSKAKPRIWFRHTSILSHTCTMENGNEPRFSYERCTKRAKNDEWDFNKCHDERRRPFSILFSQKMFV